MPLLPSSLITTDEACTLYGCSRQSLLTLAKRHGVEAQEVAGSVFLRKDLARAKAKPRKAGRPKKV